MAKSTKKKILSFLNLLFLFVLFCCLSGCGNGESKATDTGTGTGTNTTTTNPGSLNLSVPSSVTYGIPVTVTAILRDANGALVPNAVVTFAASSSLVAFTPTSATALTDVNGTASVTLNAASSSSAGATYITASAPVTTAGTTTTITSTPVGIAVHGKPDLSSLILSVTSSVVTFGTPVTATATLKDADGDLLQNAVVTFTAGSSLVAFTPTSASVLTKASGVASINLNAASINSTGATTITASAQLDTTTTITSKPVGIAVNGASVTLGALTLGQSSISSYGTSSVSVPVLIGGSPAAVPISVTFTSACVSAGKATLSSPVTSNAVTGIANSTYKDNNCNSGTDLITASVIGGANASAAITVVPPAANNMQFVSATPAIIGTQTAGAATLSKSSVVKFKVVDSNNNGVAGVLVDFSLVPASAPGGITLSSTQATSDANGEVSTSVTSGTVPTPVWVVAKVHNNPAVLSQSNTLTITTGLPAQNFFSLSVSTHNIEGWNWDGITSTVTVIASDRVGNPVPDGTAINFITEGCQITPASCTTTGGTCTVKFKSSAYRPIGETIVNSSGATVGAVAAVGYDGVTPITIDGGDPLFVQNGRVTILAYAVGEMSFLDAHGTNAYQSDDTFYDLGALYIDANENGIWDSNSTQPNLFEQYLNYAPVSSPVACGTHIGGGATVTAYPDDYATSPSKENTCSGVWGLNYVRRSQIMILSGSTAQISQHTFSMTGSFTKTFYFWLMDENYNPMPAGTTVTLENEAISYTYGASSTGAATTAFTTNSVGGTPVVDSTHAGGTVISLTVKGDNCDGTGTYPYPHGSVNIVITTPLGLKTYIPITVN